MLQRDSSSFLSGRENEESVCVCVLVCVVIFFFPKELAHSLFLLGDNKQHHAIVFYLFIIQEITAPRSEEVLLSVIRLFISIS
jgi:hypothetical protein